MGRKISDQVMVITGASSGIGLATANAAARRGAKVVLAARNAADLERAAAEIVREGGEAIAVPTDVTDYDQVAELARRAVEAYGRIDTWINNAGVSLYATFREASPEDFRQVVETNFFGQVNGARAALPHLEETAGRLICVGSTLSDRGVPLQGAYCAAKHALKGWIDALRVELWKEGSKVKITLMKPSSINTPLFNKAKTQMGVVPMPIPPVYEPEIAAGAILGAAERGGRDVFVGGAGKLMSIVERIAPELLDVQQLMGGFDAQKTDWPKPDDAPNNLYRALDDDGGLRGDFQSEAKGHSLYQDVAEHGIRNAFMASGMLMAGSALILGASRSRGLGLVAGVGGLLLLSKTLGEAISPS